MKMGSLPEIDAPGCPGSDDRQAGRIPVSPLIHENIESSIASPQAGVGSFRDGIDPDTEEAIELGFTCLRRVLAADELGRDLLMGAIVWSRTIGHLVRDLARTRDSRQ
jgi:hypothetical protein